MERKLTLSLCLRAQDQSRKAWERVRPYFSQEYHRSKPPESVMKFTQYRYSDILTRETYGPRDPMPYAEWEEHKKARKG